MDDLSLNDGDDGITWQPNNNGGGPEDVQLCLVGRFVTKRMKERLAEVWRPVRGISI